MSDTNFEELFSCLKLLLNDTIELPDFGFQKTEKIKDAYNDNSKFDLIMNRKGHYNKEKMTYVMYSSYYRGALIRLDLTGPDHYNYNTGEHIPTPHLHIMNEEYENGRIAVALDDIDNFVFRLDLAGSLISFLEYNNVKLDGIQLPFT